jgi:xanthine dehydrogenase accessory factor
VDTCLFDAFTPSKADPASAANPLQVLRFLAEADRHGQRSALVTITSLTGSSSRPVGTLMAVAEDGHFAGSFSGGCIEAAVVAEAREAIWDGRARQVRYGAGSPYLDVRLPCGGGVDLLFQPDPDRDAICHAVALLEERRPVTLVQTQTGNLTVVNDPCVRATGWQHETFVSWHVPPLGLMILGQGAEAIMLAQLGRAFGANITVLSPDERTLAFAEGLGASSLPLTTPNALTEFVADPWSAVVFLFHDHAWEPLLIERALSQPAFFIGAMGSRRTHANRLDTLRDRGLQQESLERIVSPLGLIPSARDPATLALSVLSQVVDAYRRVTTS